MFQHNKLILLYLNIEAGILWWAEWIG